MKDILKQIGASVLTLLLVLGAGVAQTVLKDYPAFFDSLPLVVVGERANVADVVGAIDLAFNLAQLSTKEVEVGGAVSVGTLSGGVSLDTADTKLYLNEYLDKVKSTLTSNDLGDLLAAGQVEDKDGTKYDYTQYATVGHKQIEYAQLDVSSGLKDPDYQVKLGTSVDSSHYLLDLWVSFTKPWNASKSVGKEVKLFGKSFTVSAETSSSQLVLFGLAEKVTVKAGESKTVSVGGKDYTVTVTGVIDSSSAVIDVNGVTKEVTEGNTYDFGGTSVYVSDVFYYKVPTETGSVVVSIGADRYVLQDGQAVKRGTSGNEQDVQGTLVDFTGDPVAGISLLHVYFDAYSTSPASDYIKAGSVWTDPVFGVKVAYGGPASVPSEQIVIQPGGTNYYLVSFTDKYGKSGTVQWAYDSDVNTAGGETLADSTGNAIHVVEGKATTDLNQYIFAVSKDFPHMLKLTSFSAPSTGSAGTISATLRDVISGTEYKVEKSVPINWNYPQTQTLVIDGQQYTVTFSGAKQVSLADSDTSTVVVYPVLATKYGAKIAFTMPNVIAFSSTTAGTYNINLRLPTGDAALTITVGATDSISPATFTAGGIQYDFTDLQASNGNVQLGVSVHNVNKPAILIVEEQRKDNSIKSGIFDVQNDASTDKRLELFGGSTPSTIFDANSVATSSDKVFHYVDAWGTKVVYDVSGAGVATITYPDTQVYHLAAVGVDPKWTVVGAGGEKVKTFVPPTTVLARLDTELTDAEKSGYHLVTVGGPVVNKVTADALGETYGSVSDTLRSSLEGKALIKVVKSPYSSSKLVLVVAGWEKEHTRAAVDAIVKGKLKDINSATAWVEGSIVSQTVKAG